MIDRTLLNDKWYLFPVLEEEDKNSAIQRIRSDKNTEFYECAMPEQVHTTLIRNGVIEEPLKKLNCSEINWVSLRDWVYKKKFSCERQGNERVFLLFEGLDTIVDVYVNGKLASQHKDMFIPHRVEITQLIAGTNELLLYFHSPWGYINSYPMRPEWNGTVPARQTIRKAVHDFCEFNGPKPHLTPVGVFRDIWIEKDLGSSIENIQFEADVDSHEKSAVVGLDIGIRDPENETFLDISFKEIGDSGSDVFHTTLPVEERRSNYSTRFDIRDIRLWWPIGFGEQSIYKLVVRLMVKSDVVDCKEIHTGFRELTMSNEFDLHINGKQVRMYGANLTPLDNHTHVYDPKRMGELLDLAEECNFNILRVWGGGEPFPKEFYREADRRGILLWMDFFHRWNRYPNDPEYRGLCRREAEWMVRNLKHHPAICLWCGGNESYLGREVEEDTDDPFIGAEIFEEDYRTICNTLDPQRLYIPNSPSWGEYSNDPWVGDTHGYTHIWFNRGAEYPLFLSESCRVSIPNIHTLKRYFAELDVPFWQEGYTSIRRRYDEVPIPEVWRRILGADALYERFAVLENYYDADNPADLIYSYGAAHGEYLRRMIESIRRGRPAWKKETPRFGKGHMVWKFNDSWPLIFSGVVDYYLEKYIPYYAMKRAYAPVLLSFEKSNSIYLWLINDGPREIEGDVRFVLFDTKKNTVSVEKIFTNVKIGLDEAKVIGDLDFLHPFNRHNVLFAEFIDLKKGYLAEVYDFMAVERRILFPQAEVNLAQDGNDIIVTTDTYAHSIELTGDNQGDVFGWKFSDNYFNLLPGRAKKIKVWGNHNRGTITAFSHYSEKSTSLQWIKR